MLHEAPLIGRDAPLARARRAMARSGHLILWGPPGVGKTRLARALADEFPGPVRWIRPDGPPPEPEPMALQILDGFDGPPDPSWLDPGDGRRLITRRARLALPGAQNLELTPLGAGGSEALMRLHVGGWRDDEAEAVEALLAALDGLPLAIELAAARWALLGARGLADRLDRMGALLQDPTREDPRHRSLGAAIGGAWESLPPALQGAAASLSALRGAFSLDDAEQMLGDDALGPLQGLRDAGWLHGLGPGRFRALEPLRRFAGVHRGADAEARHLAWVLADPGAREVPDLLAAMESALAPAATAPAPLRPLFGALRGRSHSPKKLIVLYDRAIAARGESPELLGSRARMVLITGDLAGARAGLDRALELAEAPADRAAALGHLGNVGAEMADRELSVSSFAEAAAIWEASGEPVRAAVARGELAMVHLHFGEHDACEALLEQTLDALAGRGGPYLRAHMLASRSMLWLERGRRDDAWSDLDDALSEVEAIGHDYGLTYVLACRGLAALVGERPEAARRELERALEVADGKGFGVLELRARMRLVGALGWLGDDRAWRAQVRAVRAMLADSGDATARGVFALYRSLDDIARGQTAEALRRLREASAPDGDRALMELDEEARMIRALLERRLPRSEVLRVGPEGAWLHPPGGERADLARYAASRRLLLALADAWERAPGEPLDKEALFAAGWPGERIDPSSAANRLRVELSRLRRLGLKPHLLTRDGGYLLDEALVVVRA